MAQLMMLLSMKLRALLGDKKGVTAIEYAVIAALIIVVAAVGIKTLGGDLNTLFGTTIASAVTGS